MHLKRESRILVLDRISDKIIAIVIRGYAGIEDTILLDNCIELDNFLKSRKGISGEINYILENTICPELNHKTISISSIKDRNIIKAIEETLKILNIVKSKLTQLKIYLDH